MKIGICGPVSISSLQHLIFTENRIKLNGLGGTPVNHQIAALLQMGYSVDVYTLTPELLPGEEMIIEGENLKVFIGSYRKRARQRCLDLFRKERRFLESSIALSRPDIIHAHWQYEWGWAAVDSGFPTLLTCHDSPLHVLKVERDFYRAIRLVMATIVLRRAKNLTAVSPYTAGGLKLFTRKKITVVPNFEPHDVFSQYDGAKDIGEKVNISMINNGFDARKNVAKGVQAFAQYRKKYPLAQLHLYGGANGPGELGEIWSKENNVESGVFFHGKQPFNVLMQSLKKADIFLHTSLEESCPMVLIEAMAMGIPVVAGEEAGGIPWMLKDGGGLLVNINSVEDITNALFEVSVADNYKIHSLKAREMAEEKFSTEVVIKQYIKEYNKIV